MLAHNQRDYIRTPRTSSLGNGDTDTESDHNTSHYGRHKLTILDSKSIDDCLRNESLQNIKAHRRQHYGIYRLSSEISPQNKESCKEQHSVDHKERISDLDAHGILDNGTDTRYAISDKIVRRKENNPAQYVNSNT